jgi:hypothetical protein
MALRRRLKLKAEGKAKIRANKKADGEGNEGTA